MEKKSSKQNITRNAVALLTAVLLCLGGFFVFQLLNGQVSDASVATKEKNPYKSVFISAEKNTSNTTHISVSAKSAILIEAGSGEVIWEKDADIRLPMASTTKIMTALVAIESRDIKETVDIPSSAVGIEGSSIYLHNGEKLTLEELLYAMLLESANDAAAAIAIEIGGSIEGFAEMMNKKAVELGLENTKFSNPHGLDSEDHYTTARELAVISAAAYSNPIFKTIVSTYKKTIPLNDTEGVRLLINHNKMLKNYDGATGIKTGYTKKSGRCLVSAAERDGIELIAVTLNAPDDWRDHSTMLDFGYSMYELKSLCTIGQFSYSLSVVGGVSDNITVANTEEISAILPKEKGEITYTVHLPRFVYASVSKDERIGEIIFFYDGTEIARTDLCALFDIEKASYKKALSNIFKK